MQAARPVVLVVDDDQATCDLLCELLELEGYTAESTTNGADGLARIERGGIALVLLDLWLPDIDGWELCRQVRAREDRSHVPIIAVTAAVDEESRHCAFAAGTDDHLLKPFDVDELLDRVRTWLARAAMAEADLAPAR